MTAGTTQATANRRRLNPLQAEEEFFACKWTVDVETGAPLLLLAGKNSVLRVLDVMREKLLWVRRTLDRFEQRAPNPGHSQPLKSC